MFQVRVEIVLLIAVKHLTEPTEFPVPRMCIRTYWQKTFSWFRCVGGCESTCGLWHAHHLRKSIADITSCGEVGDASLSSPDVAVAYVLLSSTSHNSSTCIWAFEYTGYSMVFLVPPSFVWFFWSKFSSQVHSL